MKHVVTLTMVVPFTKPAKKHDSSVKYAWIGLGGIPEIAFINSINPYRYG